MAELRKVLVCGNCDHIASHHYDYDVNDRGRCRFRDCDCKQFTRITSSEVGVDYKSVPDTWQIIAEEERIAHVLFEDAVQTALTKLENKLGELDLRKAALNQR